MYEKHFGLKSRPFRSRLEPSAIFVGPAQVKVMAGLKKALAVSDAVVALTGPVGVGKSTIVNRALEGISPKRVVAHVGRMQLAADEVLELLLTEFDVSRQPNGTIQRFAAFKRLLHDWALAGTRAYIVVEDAERIGTDALIELEALTAADSGDGTGASIVMMGQASLSELVSTPALARLRQRIRLRQNVDPFNAAELQGYLKHCIRAAGGEFDEIFDPGALDMIFRCSDGIPRVVNNLCESVLAAAAEANAAIVMPQLVQHVAQEQFGIQPAPAQRNKPEADAAVQTNQKPGVADKADNKAAATKSEAKPVAVPVPSSSATASSEAVKKNARNSPTVPVPAAIPAAAEIRQIERDNATEAAPDAKRPVEPAASGFESLPVSEFTANPHPQPVSASRKAEEAKPEITSKPVPVASDSAAAVDHSEIPHLIQDTQPELTALSDDSDLPDLKDLIVEPATGAKPAADRDPSMRLPTLNDIPTLSSEMKVSQSKNTAQSTPVKSARSSPASPTKPRAQPAAASIEDDDIPKLEATITEIPAWDRDPTLAELRPDIAALEEALAVPADPSPIPPAKPDQPPEPAPKGKAKSKPFDLPEITLEKELKVKEIAAQEQLLKKARPDTHEADIDAPAKRNRGFDLDRLAAELGKARSLEDVDDKLAETLFG
ncbi:MAG: AAA family ATPase, partial [Gammaproteobacteria bacterium]|nr:AAA family ATPase [Gammaproteobacteria bacterium]